MAFNQLKNTSKQPKLRHGSSAEWWCPRPNHDSPNIPRRRANSQLQPFLVHHPSELHSGLPTNTLTRQSEKIILTTTNLFLLSSFPSPTYLPTYTSSAPAVSYPRRPVHFRALTSYRWLWSTAAGRLLEPGGFSTFKAVWYRSHDAIHV